MMMKLLKIHHHHPFFSHNPQITPPRQPHFPLKFSSLSSSALTLSLSFPKPSFKISCVSKIQPLLINNEEEKTSEFEDLAPDGVVYLNTLRLVECSMFAAVTGLVYFLSNSLSIESYFGCFFSLPIVISSMRWGVAAGRKTMVATAMLLLVLSGPVKALIYIILIKSAYYAGAFHYLRTERMKWNQKLNSDWYSFSILPKSDPEAELSYTWCTWFHNGISLEVGSELGSFNFLVHYCSYSWCNGLYFDILILNKRKYTCFDHYKYPCFSHAHIHRHGH